jgi:FlaA1/EpsC-like NDP-sugar epimerase
MLSALTLTALRWYMPELTLAHVRPPYSITIISTILAFCAVLGVRIIWRFYSQARNNEKKLLRRHERIANGADVLEMMRGKTVLVTGAGGSIGSELVRQTALSGVARVIMVERSENALYEIDREMRTAGCNVQCVPEMVDIADADRMKRVLERWRPQIVLHAAAYKHVPMVEANPLDGLRNNAVATRLLGEWSRAVGVQNFVMISTDKAVNPISIMGMTKRLAEVLLLELNNRDVDGCVFSCVRFGNVLGSSGSVVSLFREQIARKDPLTVTHPEMKRYFMSVEEAVAFVLEAVAMGALPSKSSGGGGSIYTLDMGEPVRIVDLAEDMIRQAGYKPYIDIPIVFTGIRPGEKLFEELNVSEKSVLRTGHARIFVCLDPGRAEGINADEVIRFASGCPSDDEVRTFLKSRVGAP